MPSVELVIRKEGSGTYGIGEVVCDRVVLFRSGCWGLTQEELNLKLAQIQRKVGS